MRDWFVYILQCADRSFYTGITTDVERRLREHNQGKTAAKYTYPRRPLTLVYTESLANRSAACKREYQIKQLSRLQKQQLLARSGRLYKS